MDIVALSNLIDSAYRASEDASGVNELNNKSIQTYSTTRTPSNSPNSSLRTTNIEANTIDVTDERTQASHEIYYQHDVGAEDLFLGTDKGPGSFDASNIVVKIHFPDCSMVDLNLAVEPDYLLAESPKEKLSLSLPRTVNEKDGCARWDASNELLIVTLPIRNLLELEL